LLAIFISHLALSIKTGVDPAMGGPFGRQPVRAWLWTLRKLCDSVSS